MVDALSPVYSSDSRSKVATAVLSHTCVDGRQRGCKSYKTVSSLGQKIALLTAIPFAAASPVQQWMRAVLVHHPLDECKMRCNAHTLVMPGTATAAQKTRSTNQALVQGQERRR